MEKQLVDLEVLREHMDQWVKFRIMDPEKLPGIKEKIDALVKDVEQWDDEVKIGYELIDISYTLRFQKNEPVDGAIKKLESIESQMSPLNSYCFYTIKGMSAFNKGQYQEALEIYNKAFPYVNTLNDPIEEAEWHYKVAGVFYQVDKNLDSLNHIQIATELFQTDKAFNRRLATCEMIHGLNCSDLRQYEKAEECFYTSLDYAKETRDKELTAQAYHNLGVLYAGQNMSSAAIRWLKESVEQENPFFKTCYLLSREHFKLGQEDHAMTWYNKGSKLCEESGNLVENYQYKLLYTLYKESDRVFENTFKEGIAFLHGEEQWVHVKEYALDLAKHFSKSGNYKESTNFYELHVEAQQKILESEALK